MLDGKRHGATEWLVLASEDELIGRWNGRLVHSSLQLCVQKPIDDLVGLPREALIVILRSKGSPKALHRMDVGAKSLTEIVEALVEFE
jgi:hypothetical protein